MFQVEVRSRIVGSTAADIGLPNVLLDLLNEKLTVAELISLAVEEQIRDLTLTQKLDTEKMQRVLDRQYLTSEEIQHQAESGAIRFPTLKEPRSEADITQTEVRKAQHAFQKKAYLVVVDGYQPERLDETVTLHATSKVTFVRLTPLVGG